jgi:hypothetical protein
MAFRLTLATFCILEFARPSLAAKRSASKPDAVKSGVSVTHADFHGWKAIVLRNRASAIVIVPDIGRVMQFNLLDVEGNAAPGPLWNNPAIGLELKPDPQGWTNFGGDKAWPAPQADWPKMTGKAWPPSKTFDAVADTAAITGSNVELTSPVDPNYGMQVRRVISLDLQKPVMTIQTFYEKTQGAPVRVGVWTITQMQSPERAFIFLPEHSVFSQGHVNLVDPAPKDLKVNGRLLSVTRDPENRSMIGSDGNTLLWVGDGPDLLIENVTAEPAAANAEWPEQGSHSKIYTNSGDQMKYIELELLNQLHDLKPGESASMRATYTLIRRTEPDPLAEAKKVLGTK